MAANHEKKDGKSSNSTIHTTDKASTEHAEHASPTKAELDHEAVLTGVVALASLFKNCIEAFNLILPGHKWEREEQLLLCRIGLQQARLLIWGAVVGISSPPRSVTDRAVPKHPSAAYPDLNEPTFFGQRDERLDEPENRKAIEDALSAIVDRSSGVSREEMMEKYGLKPPKKYDSQYQPALDINRLEQFRELYELLSEVAESYAHISTRRSSSITRTSWCIADVPKAAAFISLITSKIDFLISLMGVQEQVDRGMRMDIKALGWHLSADRSRVAVDTSKLRLIHEICKTEYPEYLPAVQSALDNIERERRENVFNYNPYASVHATPVNITAPSAAARRGSTPLAHAIPHSSQAINGGHSAVHGEKPAKRPGLFHGLFRSLNKGSKAQHPAVNAGRSQSVSAASTTPAPAAADGDTSGPPRSLSDTGQFPHSSGGGAAAKAEMADLEPVRSMSVGAILETPTTASLLEKGSGGDDLAEKLGLVRVGTEATVKDEEGVLGGGDVTGTISRHDQYHGLGRQGTKTQW